MINTADEDEEIIEDDWINKVETITDEEKYKAYFHPNKNLVDSLLNEEYAAGTKSITEVSHILNLREKRNYT